jgi:hypothetical protein
MDPINAYFKRMVDIFGSVNELVQDFLITQDTPSKILAMPEGPGKESARIGALRILPEMKKRVETNQFKSKIDQAIKKLTPVEENIGGRRKTRKYSKKYCKKTACRRMGFTQKASCRPYKNCF